MVINTQAPQPIILCYHSLDENGKVIDYDDRGFGKNPTIYQTFSPSSSNFSGKNLQSYTFERSVEEFGGSFSFTVTEDVDSDDKLFMDEVRPLDIIVISESGEEQRKDFIGVVTTVSIGGIASNLNKVVTVSGKSIEWLFVYYNINNDINAIAFQNDAANKIFKTNLNNDNGYEGMSIKKLVESSFKMFDEMAQSSKVAKVTNTGIGTIIKKWFGEPDEFIEAGKENFKYPISSNLFTEGKITFIDFVKKLLPQPLYEVFGTIDIDGNPKLKAREAPFDMPESYDTVDPALLTDFTLTKNCEEVYTAFLPYIEGSPKSADFYMKQRLAEAKAENYDAIARNADKLKVYGYQLLTCSFVGYNSLDPKTGKKVSLTDKDFKGLSEKLKVWFSNLDEMYSGDLTIVNLTDVVPAKAGNWISFMKGLFYIISENHSWTYGDNPMINYQVIRGGIYSDGGTYTEGNKGKYKIFKPLEKVSAAYREFQG